MNKSDIFEIWPNVEVYFHGGLVLDLIKTNTIRYFHLVQFITMRFIMHRRFFAIQDLNDSDDFYYVGLWHFL